MSHLPTSTVGSINFQELVKHGLRESFKPEKRLYDTHLALHVVFVVVIIILLLFLPSPDKNKNK